MKHLHLSECPSTQTLLREKIEQNESIQLVSTSRQTRGRGRGSAQWIQPDNALAFSLALKPHPEATLTPLEVASILTTYFQKRRYPLLLKWPNDLINSQGQKCGGILCTFLSKEVILVGIGLNYGQADFRNIPCNIIKPGSIDDKKTLSERDKESMPLAIYRYISNNRMSSEQVLQTWGRYCYHQNKSVVITDNDQEVSGIFRGVTSKGEAIIENNGRQEYAMVGSLTVTH